MNIQLNGKRIITINPTINVQNANPLNTINFRANKIVQDGIRGYLVYNNYIWSFLNIAQYNMFSNKSNIQKLALVLESPHKNEYDNFYNPLGPANGKTGVNIDSKIQNRPFVSNLNIDYDYEVYLMNPVQFQCSCYNEFNNLIGKNPIARETYYVERKITSKIFRALFNKNKGNLRQNFINRLNIYSPDIIVNCCTSFVKDVINTIINKIKIQQKNKDKHPSIW